MVEGGSVEGRGVGEVVGESFEHKGLLVIRTHSNSAAAASEEEWDVSIVALHGTVCTIN